jgi:catechol 2,3-dioxygenase-like lactoylglutathione lyase family enzyme
MLHRYCFLWLAALLCTAPLSAQKVTGVGPVCITVRHLSTALAFYTQVLPFKHLGTESFYGESQENLMGQFGIHYRIAHLQLGNERVDLIDYLTSGGHSIPETQQSNDLSFQHIAIVVSDMEKAFEWLEKREVEFVPTLPKPCP